MRYDLLTHIKARPKKPLLRVNAIIAHWTANYNRGANAQANRNYFNLGTRHASAHYCVDSEEIVKCLPHTEIAYHVGARRYKPFRDVIAPGRNPNYFTIGFEMCVNADGHWPTTVKRSQYLAAWLLHTFTLPIDRLVRHFDITGKLCPAMYVDEKAWNEFRNAVKIYLETEEIQSLVRGVVTSGLLNVRSGPGTTFPVIGQLINGEIVAYKPDANTPWVQVFPDQYVHNKYLDSGKV